MAFFLCFDFIMRIEILQGNVIDSEIFIEYIYGNLCDVIITLIDVGLFICSFSL